MIIIYILVLLFDLITIHALPQVLVRPQTAILPSSSEAHLTCESNDTPFLAVAYWTHVGQRIELKPSVIEMHGNELRIFQFGDTAYTQPGAYACVVSTQYGLLESEPAMLSLPILEPFKSSSNTTINLVEGNIAVISCELPNGNPRPVPIFNFNNNLLIIERDSNHYKILPNGNLHIINVQTSDTGTYRCLAKNPLNGQVVNSSRTTVLQVTTAQDRRPLSPVFVPPVASRVLVGDNFSLECVVGGWPVPVVEWEKYGDVLPEHRNEVIHGTLWLYDIRLDDRGTYICRASNSQGQSDVAYTALLDVLEPPKVVQRPDSLIRIEPGESVSIKCGFRGKPEPIISWLFNGEEVITNGAPVTGGILALSQPKEGIYQCIGRNPYGSAQASAALVLPNTTKAQEPVAAAAAAIPKQSLIVIGPSNVTVYEGETVQLHCLTRAGSAVQWLHNNIIINSNVMRRYEMLTSGGLRIVSAQKSDSGVYECVASNIGLGTSTAKCHVHVQGLGGVIVHERTKDDRLSAVSKIDIVDLVQLDNNAIDLFWEMNGSASIDVSYVQVQYRVAYPRTSWTTRQENYGLSTSHATIDNLQTGQTYKFRLIAFDAQGKQLMISAVRRITLETMDSPNEDSSNAVSPPVPRITDAWATAEGQIGLKWQLTNSSSSETIDGFIIYYRRARSNTNFTKIIVPNRRYPPIDTYTITTIEPDQQYELRMATHSNRVLSRLSNPIEISIPSLSTQRRSRVNNVGTLTAASLDEILENITKLQGPASIIYDLASPQPPTLFAAQKSSDVLYLTIGIIAGILLILIIILIVMCALRILQRKKFVNHVKSVNGSEFYCDALQKGLNPDYATTPCLQHGVVAVDGKLIPFAYPTNAKPPMIWNPTNMSLPHSSTAMTTTDNGTMRLNTNPMNRLESGGDSQSGNQENFYHTLTPFTTHSPYEDHQCNQPAFFGYATNDRATLSSCPIHHRVPNYTSETLSLKNSSHNKDNSTNNNNNKAIAVVSSSQATPFHLLHHHHHHATCQRSYKSKRNIATAHPSSSSYDQQHELCDRSYSSSSAGGHYCAHSSNDSTRPLLAPVHHHPPTEDHDNNKLSAPASTGSSSHSSSGIGSSIESPYNHWKYLTPLCVTTGNVPNEILSSDTPSIKQQKEPEPTPTRTSS